MLFSLLGWWLVDREGELGWAPASHLEPSDDGSEVTTSKVFAPGKGELSFNNANWNHRVNYSRKIFTILFEILSKFTFTQMRR